MARVIRSPLAEEDSREIWRYIAQDNPDAADRLLRRIDEKLLLYAEYPHMGTPRENWARGLRSFCVGKYVVFYRIVAEGIELVRVLHGMRDLKTLLKRAE
jgi:toxin ParE1/3/4